MGWVRKEAQRWLKGKREKRVVGRGKKWKARVGVMGGVRQGRHDRREEEES